MALERSRVVMTYTEAASGGGAVGSGYLLSEHLVLTAAFNVRGGKGDRLTGTQVRPLGSKEWIPAALTWASADHNVALLRLDAPASVTAAPTIFGRVAGLGPIECTAVGFPAFKGRRDGKRDPEQIHGFILPLSQTDDGIFDIDVSTATPTRKGDGSPWAGMSGAAVFAGDYLVGVIVMDPGWGLRRLVGAEIAPFAEDEHFARLAGIRSSELHVLNPDAGRVALDTASVDAADPMAVTDATTAVRVQTRAHVRWLADEPVSLDEDGLGRRGVAIALDSQLREAVTPGRSFLVHVDGAWGAGKSTLLRFLNDVVASPNLMTDPSSPRAHADRWLSVEYDAWRQSRVGPPWLTLLQAVRSAVRDDKGSWWRRAWFSVSERGRLVSGWQWTALGLLIAVAALLITLVLITASGDISLTRWGDVVKLVGGLVPIAAALWLIAGSTGRFLSLDSRRSARAFLESRADPMEDLAVHFRWVLRQVDRPILLLIDDLDRCPETFVVELLDAVQKLMREPHPIRVDNNPDGPRRTNDVPGLIVVVAADGRWIRQAYDNAFAPLGKAVREPGSTIGSRFLEKLFQLTFPVPRLPDSLRRDYLSHLLAADGTPVKRQANATLAKEVAAAPRGEVLDVLAKAEPVDRLQVAEQAIKRLVTDPGAQEHTEHALEPFGTLLEPNPRAMKRFVMAYSVLRAVRTAEGSVVALGSLALWTIVLIRWPLLAEFLEDNPTAVSMFASPIDRAMSVVPEEIATLFTAPPDDLRAVMNHNAGPLDADTIRECSGQLIRQ